MAEPEDRPRANGRLKPGAISALLVEMTRAPAPSSGWEDPLAPTEHIGRFEIVREIGRGGFGVVYEARDVELGRNVALKAVGAAATAGPEESALAEAEMAARLAHANIVQLYDIGRCSRGAYLVLELLRGETLRERIQRGPVPPREALRAAVDIARGLAHAHDAGVVHRDLTPGNAFVCDDGQVKILDFGLAGVLGRAQRAGGTPGYMPPELRRGKWDARSDVYALGVMIHQLFSGALPFDVRAEQGVAPGGTPPPLKAAPAPLAKLVGKMLARDPDERPASGREVLEALVRVQRSLERRGARYAWAIAVVAAGIAILISARPRPRAFAEGRLVASIADVANTTGDRELDALSTLFRVALEQVRHLSLIDRGRALELLRQPGAALPSRIDERFARIVAEKAPAQAMLIPTVRRVGAEYEVELRALELPAMEPLFTLRERTAARAGVLDAIDGVADKLRDELREGPPDPAFPRVRAAQIVPAAPEAWRHYSDAQRLESEGRRDEMMAAYRRALDADPEFPLAHVQLAYAEAFRDRAAVAKHLDAAMRGIDRVPPKERLYVQASRMLLNKQDARAVEFADRAIAGWPQDPRAYQLALYIYLEDWADGAGGRPYLEKVVALSVLAPGAAIHYLLLLGRHDEALERARRFVAESPGRSSFAKLSVVHRVRGELKESLTAARRALSFGGDPPYQGREGLFWSFVEADAADELDEAWRRAGKRSWQLLALQGRRREALAVLDESAPPQHAPPMTRARFHNLRGDYLWGDVNPDLVWREASEEMLLGSSFALCAASSLIWMGDMERAQQLTEFFVSFDNRFLCVRLARHLGEWKRGELESAIRGLRGMWMPLATFHLGEVLAEAGRHEEAIQSYRDFRRWPEWDDNPVNISHAYPLSLLREAVSLEHLGRRQEALTVLDRLLSLWRRADADLPPLLQAKALRSRLAIAATGKQ